MGRNLREASRDLWAANSESFVTTEEITLGSILRIADATEKMAANYTQLQNNKERYEKLYHLKVSEINKLYRRISALRGVITRQKKAKKK
jgi:glycine/D-amino acid oxidase-like deaminating enzyme